MNTSAPLFTDLTQQSIVDKQKAELYMQIYQYAAEDFFSNADMNGYNQRLVQYLVSLELQLDRLMKVVATHKHIVPPHMHQGAHGPTSPWTGSTTPPLTGSSMVWTPLDKPLLAFTTGATPNLTMNRIVKGTTSEGGVATGGRRALPLPITLLPTIPPVLKGI